MDKFAQGFYDELENIQKEGFFWGYAIPSMGFAGYDVYRAGKEQLAEGPRTEEARQRRYLTKYPSLGELVRWPTWVAGKGLEALGRRGDSPWHRAASMGAATIGAGHQIDPLVALQKGLGG